MILEWKEDLCAKCRFLSSCDDECQAGNYIESRSSYNMVVVECEEFEEKDE